METKPKKLLKLERETVKTLSDADLTDVAGGTSSMCVTVSITISITITLTIPKTRVL
jgi:hypothetical protein